MAAISDQGGDLRHQRLNLVVGFSTGHMGQDNVPANAARDIAFKLCKGLLVRGDTVSIRRWEMDVWSASDTGVDDIRYEEDATTDRRIWAALPTLGKGSGHDTEQAIIRFATEPGAGQDRVIVLLTPDAASQSPTGENPPRPIGKDSDAYKSVLEEWNRVAPKDQSVATVRLSYGPPAKDGSNASTIDAVLVVRRGFKGEAISGPERDLERNFAAVSNKIEVGKVSDGSDALYILLGVAALALLAFLVAKIAQALKPRRPLQPQRLMINGVGVSLVDRENGDVVCTLVGLGYPTEAPEQSSDGNFPPKKVATFYFEGDHVRVVPESYDLVQLSTTSVTGPQSLPVPWKGTLGFMVEIEPDPAAILPATQKVIDVPVEVIG